MQKSKHSYSTIDFMESNLRIKNILHSNEKEKAYRLRHKIFVDELKWVAAQADLQEIDDFDGKGMVPLGVFDKNERIIAHLRITLPQKKFMMEREFAGLIEKPVCRTDNTVEISRVCTEKDTRTMKILTPCGYMNVSMLLYKGLYCWCRQNLIDDMCMVIETKLFRLLKMSGFPCQMLGKNTLMPDGVSAVAVRVDWRRFRSINQNNKPQLLDWFNNIDRIKKAA